MALGRTLIIVTIALGYTRVSTERQEASGLGLESQQRTIRAEAERRGWAVHEILTDVGSGKSVDGRPQLARAVGTLNRGEAQALIVAKLDRLSRSLVDFAQLTRTAQVNGWSIVALDIGVDTSTVNGELVANIIMALAQWERRLIGQRVKAALAVAQARGTQVGRPSGVSDQTLEQIVAMRGAGQSYRSIADAFNTARVPTAHGGRRWHPSTVQKLHRSITDDAADADAAAR